MIILMFAGVRNQKKTTNTHLQIDRGKVQHYSESWLCCLQGLIVVLKVAAR